MTSYLKEIPKILVLYAHLKLSQDAVGVSLLIGFCIYDKTENVKDTQTMGVPEAEYTCTSMDIISQLSILSLGIPI